MPIPKKIHFIWAGGEKLMPEENIKRMKAWAAKNPDFEVCLWIDKASTSKEKLKEYETHFKFNDPPKIILKDITEEGVVDAYSRYHIDKLVPNYGASSDILRYSILKKFGGAYFDSDILVTDKTNPLNYKGLFDSTESDILRITQFTQGNPMLGNDAFICTPNHPFIRELYKTAQSNHRDQWQVDPMQETPYNFDNPMHSKPWTIRTTGPTAVLQTCANLSLLGKADPQEKINLDTSININGTLYNRTTENPALAIDKSCYQAADRNDFNWLKAPIRKCVSLDEAMKITIDSIRFEATNLGLLRLDEHVKNIIASLKKESPEKNAKEYHGSPHSEEIHIADKLLAEIRKSNIDFSHLKYIQLMSRFQGFADFYQQMTPHLADGALTSSHARFVDIKLEKDFVFSKTVLYNFISHLYNKTKDIYDSKQASVNLSTMDDLVKAACTVATLRRTNKTNELFQIQNQLRRAISQTLCLAITNCIQSGNQLPAYNPLSSFLPKFEKEFQFKEEHTSLTATIKFIINSATNKDSKELSGHKLKEEVLKHLHTYPHHFQAIHTTLKTLATGNAKIDDKNIVVDEPNKTLINDIDNKLIKRYKALHMPSADALAPLVLPSPHLSTEHATIEVKQAEEYRATPKI